MDVLQVAWSLLAGVLAGGVFVWLLMRAREQSRVAEAVAQAQGLLQVDLAKATMRADQAEVTSAQTASDLQDLRQKADGFRNDLDAARDQCASLGERALRIPILEAEAKELERARGEISIKLDGTNQSLADARESLGRANAKLAAELQAAQASLDGVTQELATERQLREAAHEKVVELTNELAGLRAEQRSAAEKLDLLTEAKETLSAQFKVLANDIFDEKSKRFTDQNQTNLSQLLDPLRVKLTEFQGKVEQVYVEEGKERVALGEQVRQLVTLNQTLSEDAKNLTSALKGSAKTQGNWGELILERVLEASGLRKGEEYVSQEMQSTTDGRRLQPDVVINLPEGRHLVVDAKVSLVAYEQYSSADTDAQREAALKRHLDSVRNHVRTLAEKKYQSLYALQTLDFVLMFVPIEPAFMIAVTNDRELFMDAWQKNVCLVSPSTLLFVVRTVAHLWRQEAQNRNAQEIARRGGELYDKLVGFVTDLNRVGEQLKSAQGAYDEAEKKLVTGKGNVIRQAEMLRDLGVKPVKQLPRQVLELAMPDESQLSSLLDGGEPADVAAIATPSGV